MTFRRFHPNSHTIGIDSFVGRALRCVRDVRNRGKLMCECSPGEDAIADRARALAAIAGARAGTSVMQSSAIIEHARPLQVARSNQG